MKTLVYQSILLSCFWMMVAGGIAQQNESFFYYYQNQQQPLEICTDQVLVKFSAELSLEQKQRILMQHRLLEPKFMKQMAGVDVVPVHRGVNASSLLAMIREMESLSDIEYIHPYFYVDGTEQPLSYRDDILVKLADGNSFSQLQAIAERHGLRPGKTIYEAWGMYQLISSSPAGRGVIDLANQLQLLPEIEAAEPNFFGGHAGHYVPNDPDFLEQYSIRNIGVIPGLGQSGSLGADMRVTGAWDITTGCSDITIAIIDDGVDLNHPDLMPNLVGGYDGLVPGGNGMRFPGDTHGTACAGTAAAKGDNNIGCAGVAYDCSIMPIRAFSDTFGASSVSFALGFIFAATNGADVISNSWGWGQSSILDFCIQLAATLGRGGKGCIVLSSSGNDNQPMVGYPARNPYVIAVGAGNHCDERKRSHSSQSWMDDTTTCGVGNLADPQGVSCDRDSCWGSDFGIDQELLAPGIFIYTTFENNGYGWFQGTSAACPNAAGVAALILSVDPELTGLEAEEILLSTARKPTGYTYLSIPFFHPYGTWNPEVGYGIPHAEDAVKEANKNNVLYIQNETFTSPPLADIRSAKSSLFAGRQVTNTQPQGEVKIVSPGAPLTFFQAGNRVVLRPGFRAGQQTLFEARIFQAQCPVKP